MAETRERFIGPNTLDDGEALVFDARDKKTITVITDDNCTATVSRVDALGAADHTSGDSAFTVAAATLTATAVDWPFFRVSAAGGTCRVALV